MKLNPVATIRVLVSLAALYLLTLTVVGQQSSVVQLTAQASLTGKYEGSAKDATGEAKVTLDLVDDSGKFSGAVTTPLGVFKVVKGQMVDGLLSLEIESKGPPHKLSLRQKDDKLVGTILDGAKTANIELRRVAKDEISGDWEAAADAQGQAIPFNLTLKLEGEKVTGSSSSQLGDSTISSGTYKDGKLAIVLDSGGGPIALVATIVDGKLAGDFDYNGQLQGKWVATRRKP
jgi:hypothetical protein